MIPSQICNQLPQIINEKVNSKLSGLPQAVGVSQMLSLFSGALMGLGGAPSQQYVGIEVNQCKGPAASQLPIPQTAVPPAPGPAATAPVNVSPAVGPAPQIPQASYNEKPAAARGTPQRVYQTNQATTLRKIAQPSRPVAHAAPPRRYRAVPFRQGNERKTLFIPTERVKREVARIYRVTNANAVPTGVATVVRLERGAGGGYGVQPYPSAAVGGYQGQQGGFQGPPPGGFTGGSRFVGPRLPPPPPVRGAPPPTFSPPPVNLCAKCPAASGGGEDPMQFLKLLGGQLDMRKLNDLYLSLQLLNTQATSNDFTIDLSGEFSPNAQGG
ncbi:unnamed protein product, partial [Cylicostephanus goldi]